MNMVTTGVIRESVRGYETLNLTNLLFSSREIYFVNEVNSDSCSELIQQVRYLESESHDEIKLFINSPGGAVDSGLAAYDMLRLLKSPLTTICMGTAASMGSILFLAGEKRMMLPHSRVMIHDPSFGGGSYAGKKPDELQSELNSLVKTRERLTEIIVERTGQPRKTVLKKTAADSYFTAEEAIEFGLATEIVTEI